MSWLFGLGPAGGQCDPQQRQQREDVERLPPPLPPPASSPAGSVSSTDWSQAHRGINAPAEQVRRGSGQRDRAPPVEDPFLPGHELSAALPPPSSATASGDAVSRSFARPVDDSIRALSGREEPQPQLHQEPQLGVVSRDQPRAKRAARRSVLPAWEDPSDSEDDIGAEEARAVKPQGQECKPSQPSQRKREEVPQTGKQHKGALQSYEQKVLKLEPETAFVRNAKAEAVRHGFPFFQVRTDGQWTGSAWKGSTDEGSLGRQRRGDKSIEKRDAASAVYQGLPNYANVDIEATLEITDGDRAGLLFRVGHIDYSAMVVNIPAQTVELCRGSRTLNELTPPADGPISLRVEKPIARKSRHTLRVMAVADKVEMYFDNQYLGKFDSPMVEKSVIIPKSLTNKQQIKFDIVGDRLVVRNKILDQLAPGDAIVEVNSVRNSPEQMKAEFYKQSVGTILRCARVEPGLVGIWAGRNSSVKVKNFSLTDLTKYEQDLRDKAAQAVLAADEAQKKEFENSLLLKRQLRAAATIQRVAKARCEMARQHVKLCKEFEAGKKQSAGPDTRGFSTTENPQRQKALLQWVALMTFFNKVDEILHEPEIFHKLENQFLQAKDDERAPPPPPPTERPPSREEELIFTKYAEKSKVHCERAEAAFLRDYHNAQRFEQMRSDQGQSAKEKARIANICYKQAQQATSEKEHQALLRKAYCLEKDFVSMSESNDQEFHAWLKEKESKEKRPASSAHH